MILLKLIKTIEVIILKELEKIEKLLINVDMVNGFVKQGGMADSYIQHIIPENIKLMEQVKKSKNQIIAIIKDTHKKQCREFKRYPEHCVEGTNESELISELQEFEEGALVYKKNSTSTIYAPKFLEDIDKMINLKEVTIIGCRTDICIINLAIPLQNYFDQQDRNVLITIPTKAVETYDAPNHNRDEYNEMAFKLMKQAGIKLI